MNNITTPTWYTEPGIDDDVICSSRVRLARNLCKFPFPEKLSSDDKQIVQRKIFKAFDNNFPSDEFQKLPMNDVEIISKKIFAERSVLSQDAVNNDNCALILRKDGKVNASVNITDHLHLAAFNTGFSLNQSFEEVCKVDEQLQNSLEFAASPDFGYLNSKLKDVGTGAKFSVMLHLPSLTATNMHLTEFKSLVYSNYEVFACYTSSKTSEINALGAFYRIVSNSSYPKSEFEQIEEITNICNNLIDKERELRFDFITKNPTVMKNKIHRALGLIQYSKFICLAEGIELLAGLKWGVDLGLFKGIKRTELLALLYRIQPAHLALVIRSTNFNFEKDVVTPEQKMDRLRALLLQEAITTLEMN